jgi:hypothetical protein
MRFKALVAAIEAAGISLPGINGDAVSAADFAGEWSEVFRSAVIPFQGTRLYEWSEPQQTPRLEGVLVRARKSDRALLVDWVRGFQTDIGEQSEDNEFRVDQWLEAGELWVWENGEPMSMAVCLMVQIVAVSRCGIRHRTHSFSSMSRYWFLSTIRAECRRMDA